MNSRFLEPGTRLSRYVIRERLGRGAAATVYLAEDSSSGALVALKTLHDPKGSQAADRLKREIALARRIAHPGVCNVFEIQEHDDFMFLTLEYIPGRTLEAEIERNKLAPPRAARVMRSVCAALREAHELDILHRDLKPGNIMLRPDDTPAILDFGYATGPNVARLTQTGVWVGTLQYLAPEILKNQPASKSSDIYSLGVTLYRCLTAEYPFPGVTFGEIASAVLFHDPTPPGQYVPDLDPGLQAVVLKAMARERRERYLHVGELENDLGRLNLGEDVTDPGRLAPPEVIAGEKSLPHALVLAIEASTTQREAMLATVLVAEPASLEGERLSPDSNAARRWLMLRYDLLHPEVEKWQGTTLGARGEELMAWFATADDAVRAALAMQRLLEPEGVAADGPDHGVAVRIGIQTGYAQLSRGRLTGEAAAAAGRIAASASLGDIVVTGTARASLSDHLKPLAERLEPRHPAPVAEVLYRIESGESARTSVKLRPRVTAPLPMSDEAQPAVAAEPPRRPIPQPMSVEMTPSQEGIAVLSPVAELAREPKPRAAATARKPEAEKSKLVLDLATLREEHASLVQSLRDARRERGIIIGDNGTLDGLERTAELELSRGAWDAGVECLQLATKELTAVTIDNKFVATKLQRLHIRMREKGVRRDEGEYEALLAEIMNAFKSRKFEAANAALNRAFALLA